jgi:8-oxo-dGTP pyrophosphatase MutT (NUDIX family)
MSVGRSLRLTFERHAFVDLPFVFALLDRHGASFFIPTMVLGSSSSSNHRRSSSVFARTILLLTTYTRFASSPARAFFLRPALPLRSCRLKASLPRFFSLASAAFSSSPHHDGRSSSNNSSHRNNKSRIYASTLLSAETPSPSATNSTMTDSIDDASALPLQQFPEEILQADDYKGVSIRLDWLDSDDGSEQEMSSSSSTTLSILLTDVDTFRKLLTSALATWHATGQRGIWIHVPTAYAAVIPVATTLGFQFHMIHQEGHLVLSRWLPTDTPSRLPRGPLSQVGVGCLVLHPEDDSQVLVVKECTGPAARKGLWKMPTGLADPAEDIHAAAVRELREETGLEATCLGIVVVRQAHAHGTRTASDLFFVCRMQLTHPTEASNWTAQPEEIAAIQWMSLADYSAQEAWQDSPVYHALNQVLLNSSQHALWAPTTLPLGWEHDPTATNTLYKSHL